MSEFIAKPRALLEAARLIFSNSPKFVQRIIVCCAVLLALKFAWSLAYPSGTWRYKMTVTVETPEGIKTGSVVREVSVQMQPLLPESHHDVKVKGEAVVVDLGKRGVLFGLLRGDIPTSREYGSQIFAHTFYRGRGWMTRDGIKYLGDLKSPLTNLEINAYPMFVTFKDISDPMSLIAVSARDTEMPDGHGGSRKLPNEVFGSGVRIQSVSIETTRDPVTNDLKKYLPWLSKTPGYLSGETTGGEGLVSQMDRSDFIRGDLQ